MGNDRIVTAVKTPARTGADGLLVVPRGDRSGIPFVAPFPVSLAMEGRIFIASDADQNDLLTGQTSFANTTPTLLLSVPSGTTAIPLFANLAQTSTVGGGAVDVIIEIDNADRYSTGGTAETVLSSRTDGPVTKACTLYSGATASSGYGVRVFGITLGQDVSPAEGAPNMVAWKPEVPMYLVGPASFLVFTYAGTTGPTWFWSVGWAEIPSTDLT